MPTPSFLTLPDHAPELLHALAREADAHALQRKLLVAPAAGAGRELLRTFARARGGWVGFDVTTVRPLAARAAVEWIASEEVRVLDAFEEEARIDDALDLTFDGEEHRDAFGELAEGTGFRRAVRSAVTALRLTGVDAESVEKGGFEDRRKQFLLATVLRHYEGGLTRDRVIDVAGLLERATLALERGARLPTSRILLMPGLGLRGRAGRFLRALEARGAIRLSTDPVVGLSAPRGMLWAEGPARSPLSRLHEPPGDRPRLPAVETLPDPDPSAGLPLFDSITPSPSPPPEAEPPAAHDLHLFRAAGVQEELREVLRRVVGSGHGWDEVEIVTPDPFVYGPALQSLAARLDIDTTFAVGLPVGRTRPGRAVTAYLRWISDDFPAPVLRRLLQSGDLVAPGGRAQDSPYLARSLRALRIGWGRKRYRALVTAALERRRAAPASPGRHQSAEAAQEHNDREVSNLLSLDRLLRVILSATPAAEGGDVAPADVARGLFAFLAHVPAESEVDRSAHERLLATLDRIAHTLQRPTRFSTAVAVVREHLDIRVPAPRAEGRAPWLADGGALHLSDLVHGGLSGRRLMFVVGMDAGRFPGGDRQDPFLLDRERRTLDADLPTTDDRLRERHFAFAALLARTRAEVTVSYPAWEAAEGRVLQPASVLLTLFRMKRGDPALGYEDLEVYLDAPASRIPRDRPALDADDVWMGALGDGGRLRDGRAAIRARYTSLDRGLGAAEAATHSETSPHVGFVRASPERSASLDPRVVTGPRLSASALETLGQCPLKYLYSRVLRVQKPDDPEFDLEKWLPAPDRGSLLHDVFQAAVEAARAEPDGFSGPGFVGSALEILARFVARKRAELPPPSETVLQAEVVTLRDDVRSFCAHLRQEGPAAEDVVATEWVLGGDEPLELSVPGGGSIRIRGRVDRVDRVGEGLRIVDYKTGRPYGHGDAEGTYDGGRRLQHVLYARAVETQSPHEGAVALVEYQFPTVRGENTTYAYDAAALADGMELVASLLKLPALARFPATNDAGDCRYCDYRPVCRYGSVEDEKGAPSTPRVEWTRAREAEGDESVAPLLAVRTFEKG